MKPKLVFMGTPDFGVPSLDYLLSRDYPVLAVVTQPDRAKGRGQKPAFSEVKNFAQAHGLSVLQPENVNSSTFLETLKALAPMVVVVAAFGQLLKQPLLDLPLWGCINLHGSLLPRYRGAAPIQWAIANGEKETGITVQRMALKMDSGPILTQRKVDIGPDDRASEVFDRLAHLGGPALEEALELLAEQGPMAGVPQDEALATYAPRLTRTDGELDWRQPALVLHDRVRGFYPWPGTYTEANGEKLKILATRPGKSQAPASVKTGTILEVDPDRGWLVATGGNTTLWVLDVQCANSKAMAANAYTCGYRVGAGDVLGRKEKVG